MDDARLANVIRRAQQRDAEAFDELIDAYSTRLYGYFYRLTGSRPDAEDLLQEAFLRLVRMIGAYEHDGRFEAWLFRIATNLVRDRVRRARTARSAGVEPGAGSAETDADPLVQVPDRAGAEPADQLDQAEQVDRLQAAISELPEAEREVILLRHFSQMPFQQIADLMGTPLGTALARGHRGLARLRQLMEPGSVNKLTRS